MNWTFISPHYWYVLFITPISQPSLCMRFSPFDSLARSILCSFLFPQYWLLALRRGERGLFVSVYSFSKDVISCEINGAEGQEPPVRADMAIEVVGTDIFAWRNGSSKGRRTRQLTQWEKTSLFQRDRNNQCWTRGRLARQMARLEFGENVSYPVHYGR